MLLNFRTNCGKNVVAIGFFSGLLNFKSVNIQLRHLICKNYEIALTMNIGIKLIVNT